MARLFEYQSKELLRKAGIPIPLGEVVFTPEETRRMAEKIGKPVVLKIQVWITGRASLGGIQFARTPQEAEEKAKSLFGLKVKNFIVDRILVEECLNINSEYFVGLTMDDARKCPVFIFSSMGGTGIEDIARAHPERTAKIFINVHRGLEDYQARNLVRKTGLPGSLLLQLTEILTKFYRVCRLYDARSGEINPLVLTDENLLYAADCHLVIDDYAVYRHPELGIDVAREFDRPATELEKIAYKVEEKDYRGTFYFFQMTDKTSSEKRYIGFHGAGGGGSMMSMDAVLNRGFCLANYCDTSGNPAASKVYRAAKIILSQPFLCGYFASGSGVASQEQYHSARGLVKAFREENLEIPAVIRLGGNYEEEAIRILHTYLKDIPGKVEAYGRDDSPEFCARRLEELVASRPEVSHKVRPLPDPPSFENAYHFATLTGNLAIHHQKCLACRSRGCIEACPSKILKLEEGKPVLAVTREEAKKGKCTECLGCEIYCTFHEQKAIDIFLPIPGLKEYREKIISLSEEG